jgi:hypothetical protein
MHETGHSIGLTHGGFYYDNQLAGSYVPTIEPNCKPNFQSVMNYFFQVDLLDGVPDYSEQQLDPLNEGSLPPGVTFGGGAPLHLNTKWYTPVQPTVGNRVSFHCDGSPVPLSEPATWLVPGPADPTSPAWATPESDVADVDYGVVTSPAPILRGFNDWTSTNSGATTTNGIDLRQVGATGNGSVFSEQNYFGGGQSLSGSGALNGGGRPINGGGQALDGSGEGGVNGGGRPINGGGRPINGGGRPINGGGEIDQATADSYTRPPTGLMVTQEEVSPRYVDLSWTAPTFGQIGTYNIYRSSDGGKTFTKIASVNAPQTTYQDQKDSCNPTGYEYFVTAVLSNSSTNPGQESVPSNIVTNVAGQNPEPLTGCYALTGGSNLVQITGFSSPANGATFTQGDLVPIAYPVNDDFYPTGGAVLATAANKTVAIIGPLPSPSHDNSCALLSAVPVYSQNAGNYTFAPVTLLSSGGNGITILSNQFSLNWNTTSVNAGCYVLEADFDSGQVARTQVQVTIYESDSTPHILTTTLPNATVGTPYLPNTTIQESGGTGPFTWSITAGALPSGFTLNATTGAVSGMTTAPAGNYTFTVQVTDSKGNFGTRQFTLPVLIFISDTAPTLPAPYTLTTTLTNAATVGSTYLGNTLQQAGGTAPFNWTITSGALPPGLTLNAATGTVSGITTAPAGNYTFTVQVTDSKGNMSGTIPFTLPVLIFISDTPPALPAPYTLTTTLTNAATVGSTYLGNTLQQAGGTAPFNWTITSGALPSGFMLNPATGAVTGTTTAPAGNYNFTVQVTDSKGNMSGMIPFTLPVLIFISDTMPALPAPYTLTTTLSNAATVGSIYPGNTLQQAGGTAPLNWIITSGALPSGFTLNPATGAVSGITTAPAGNYSFTVQVTDSKGNRSGMIPFTLPVLIFISDTMPALPAPYTVTTTLPQATAGIAYNPNTIQEAGGVGAVSWNITAGTPPPGMSFGSGTLSGTPTTAGNYTFTVQATDSNGSMSGMIQFMLPVQIFVSDSTAPTVTKTLPPAPVGSSYNNPLDETGGTGTLTWTIIAGALPPGLSLSSNSGVVSGTPTTAGNYNFTAQVMDSASPPNVAALAFMLSVPDAQYGDLIVVDGSSTANPLGGTLFRITSTGAAGTIAAISNGSPTGVAVDSGTGNIYVAVDSVGVNGTTRIVKIDPFGAVTDPFIAAFPVVGAVLQSPVALAVDKSGNLYVGDNQANKVYEFSSSGTQVGAGSFASLPSSNNVLNHIRMAFDSSGNLDVTSDSIGGVTGQVEVDQLAPNGTLTVLYNTTTKSTATYLLNAAGNTSGGNTTYTGTFSPTLPVGSSVTISGFTNTGNDSSGGPFTVVSCTSTQLVVNNGGGVAETPASPGTATLQLTQIGTVGGITVLPDGSLDLADSGAQAIYNITNPGATNMGITTAISAATASNPPPSPLCCSISGMANPLGNTSLYVSLNGANSTAPQLQLAVPQTSSVTAVNSTLTYSLTAAGAVDQSGNTTYTGTFSPTIPAGSLVNIAGFTNAGNNSNGFTVVSCTSTQLVVVNGSGVAETHAGTTTIATPLTSPNDVAWYSKQ